MNIRHPRRAQGTRGTLQGRRATGRVTRASSKTAQLVAAAAAIAAAGSLLGSVSAQAIPPVPLHPPCTNDWVGYGPTTVDHSDGVMVNVPWNGHFADPTPEGATLYLADGSPAQVDKDGKPVGHGSHGLLPGYHSDQTGTAFGGINGNTIDFTVVWDSLKPVSSNRYTGTVNPDGYASGSDTNSGNGITTQWHMEAAFACGG